MEAAFTAAWSVGELLYAARRPSELLRDPWREPVLADIQERGLYAAQPGEEAARVEVRRGGGIALPNPYRYIGPHPQDKIVARLERAEGPPARRLLVLCHCYGVPLPGVMRALFQLQRLEGYDIVYNIMNKHYLGSFGAWPGFGLVSARLSQVIEVMRSAITGLRVLIRALQASRGYEEVSLLGYSIGGQLALHAANHLPLSRLALYCPVVRLDQTMLELGWMDRMAPHVERTLQHLRPNYSPADLACLDPLAPPRRLLLPQGRVLVLVQRNDRMTPLHQIEPLRDRYPEIQWHAFDGTHVIPADLPAFTWRLRQHLEGGAP